MAYTIHIKNEVGKIVTFSTCVRIIQKGHLVFLYLDENLHPRPASDL